MTTDTDHHAPHRGIISLLAEPLLRTPFLLDIHHVTG